MKKIALVLSVLAIAVSPSVVFSLDATFPATPPANESSFATMGYPSTCATVYVDNVARTVQSLVERAGCAWQKSDATTGRPLNPIGMMVSCDDKATRWAADMTPTAAKGHKLLENGSFYFPGPGWPAAGMAISAGATDNVACSITRSY